jgi:hypothetical protein
MRWALFLCLVFLASPGFASPHKNHVLVTVAGKAITQRGLGIEAVLSNPRSVVLEKAADDLSPEERDRLLQKLIVRSMVEEENRVLNLYRVTKSDLDRKEEEFIRAMGAERHKRFLKMFEVAESDIRERLSANIVLEKVLSEQEDLERWLKQLRSRHTVTYLKTPASP